MIAADAETTETHRRDRGTWAAAGAARISTVLKQIAITPADIERSILWAVGERASPRAGAAEDRSAANG